MYNLGVFYVHGWGGLESDTDKAKEMFQSAAKLGQKEAMNALSIDLKENINNDNKYKNRTVSEGFSEFDQHVLISEENYNYKVEPKNTDDTSILFNVLGISLDSFSNTNTVTSNIYDGKSVDSGIIDLSPGSEVGFHFDKLHITGNC